MNEAQHTRVKQLVQSLQDLYESRRDRRKEYQDLDVANLVFYHPPSSDAPPLHLQPCHDLDVVRHDSSRDPFFLRHDVLENTGYLRYEEWLLDRHTFVANLLNHTSTQVQLHASVLLHDLAADIQHLDQKRMLEWERQRSTGSPVVAGVAPAEGSVDTTRYLTPMLRSTNPIIALVFVAITVLHLLCGVSIDHCGFLVSVLAVLVETTLSVATNNTTSFSTILSNIPKDPRTIIRATSNEPVTTTYVCCPRCFAIYPLNEDYPDRCVSRTAPEEPQCNAALRTIRTIGGKRRSVPIRKFVYQHFAEWFAAFICRPGVEDLIDRSYSRKATEASDIWEASIMADVMDTDGSPFFSSECSGRYAWSICVDGFAAYGKGGPTASLGSCYLACLNLPPQERYKYENMFLAFVVPGPNHLNDDQPNHLLRPLIDDFLKAWLPGIHLSSTLKHPTGRMTRHAIVPAVADLLAIRSMVGFSPHNSKDFFCSFCLLPLKDKENFDWESWPKRTCEEHRRLAQAWSSAKTKKERNTLFEANGVRWSELLRLPYWDPIKYSVIDVMHTVLLRVVATEIQQVLGMSFKHDDGLNGISFDLSKKQPSTGELIAAFTTLKTGSAAQVRALRKPILKILCRNSGLSFRGAGGKLKSRLLDYRRQQGWFDDEGNCKVDAVVSQGDVSDADISDALEAVQKNSIRYFKKDVPISVIQKVCAQLLGDHFPNETKDALIAKLHAYRVDKGISDASGMPLQPQPRKARNRKKGPPDVAEISEGETLFQTGTRTDLNKLRLEVLRHLCIQKLATSPNELEVMSKPQVLTYIHNQRIEMGILDQKGRLIRKKPRSGSSRVVSSEDMAKAEHLLSHGTTSRLKQLRSTTLIALCVNKLKRSIQKAPQNKDQALALLKEYRRSTGIVDASDKVTSAKIGKDRILGKNMMKLICEDIQQTIFPSWITPVSMQSLSDGHLSADGWRTFATVHLVTSLIFVWGSKPAASREHGILSNFMHLAAAVRLATMRTTNATRTRKLREHMKAYLCGLLELFPGVEITPSHHLMLGHLPDILNYMGPAHAIWCFGFERGNGILEHIVTNKRIYDMPGTMLTKFCHKQNLRSLFVPAHLPDIVHQLIPKFLSTFHGDVRGTLNSVINTGLRSQPSPSARPKDVHTTKQLRQLVLGNDVSIALKKWVDNHTWGSPDPLPLSPYADKVLTSVESRGFTYAAKRRGDSNVIFHHEEHDQPTASITRQTMKAGSIRQIFQYTWTQAATRYSDVFVVLDEFEPLDPAHQLLDPYSKFEFAGTLFKDSRRPEPTVITLSSISCHFVMRPRRIEGIPGDLVHILPLDDVRVANFSYQHSELTIMFSGDDIDGY